MINKYNIALLPTSKSDDVIKCAQFFSKISDQYQLGENSLPHVTLCQFRAYEKEIENLWTSVRESLPNHSIQLEFKDFSYIAFDNIIHWISLMPNQCAALHEMHRVVANIINDPINKSYDPHMTLINTKDDKYKNIAYELSTIYSPISDNFVLSIGDCDSIGQFTRVIYKSMLKSTENMFRDVSCSK